MDPSIAALEACPNGGRGRGGGREGGMFVGGSGGKLVDAPKEGRVVGEERAEGGALPNRRERRGIRLGERGSGKGVTSEEGGRVEASEEGRGGASEEGSRGGPSEERGIGQASAEVRRGEASEEGGGGQASEEEGGRETGRGEASEEGLGGETLEEGRRGEASEGRWLYADPLASVLLHFGDATVTLHPHTAGERAGRGEGVGRGERETAHWGLFFLSR